MARRTVNVAPTIRASMNIASGNKFITYTPGSRPVRRFRVSCWRGSGYECSNLPQISIHLDQRLLQLSLGVGWNAVEQLAQVDFVENWCGAHLVFRLRSRDVDFSKTAFHFSKMSIAADIDGERLVVSG